MADSAQIQKMSPKHEAILNYILVNPTMSYREVAGHFQVTPAWLSTIIHSHAFQDQLKRRHDEVFDAAVLQSLDEKLVAAGHMTLDKYLEAIPTMSTDQTISAADKVLGRLGFGSKGASTTVINGDVSQTVTNNHVRSDVLKEARERIGTHKVGASDSQAALPRAPAEKGVEIEGVAVRKEGESGPS